MAAESTAASTGRSGASGASADSYIGSLISLTSKSEIRYEGVLHNINTEESSIGLRNVRSFGTEGRKKDGTQVPPSDKTYDYILFRGSDIKDLQVKASPPVQGKPPIDSDPAIIQSHYLHPTTPSTSLPAAPSGSFADLGSSSSQLGLLGSNFQSGLPLYQPGANMNSWGPSPPNANGSGLAMPMYWQGFYGTPNGMPQIPQQSLLRPPPGMTIPPSLQQMQFSSINSSLPTTAASLPSSNFPEFNPSIVPNNTITAGLTSSSLPVPTLSLNGHPLQPAPLASGTTPNLLPNKALASTIPISIPSSNFPTLVPSSTVVLANAGVPSVANTPNVMSGQATFSQQTISLPVTVSATGASVSVPAETMLPALVTPGQLLQSGPATVSSPQILQTTQKDVEVFQVLPKSSSGPPAPVAAEAQPAILPLPTNTRNHKHNGAAYHTHNNFRGYGGSGRGSANSRPVTNFTEDFDFMAMNEKFKKDEVWGHLGRSNKSHSKDKETNGATSDEYESHDDEDAELRKIDVKPGYNKDDFFDSLSSNTSDYGPSHGRTRYSEQMKMDSQTFGEFSRYQNRGRGRGGGRFHGSYHRGRGYGGYGYTGRSRGRGRQNHHAE
ncbi:protein decapping 5-like [Dorcoceras hygrometricum]|uniref:Protein decapping 5-like n=1 Tax=Dorcoceras hygrometricum TaxID=472368 RepID=A0A2Z7BR74_9LAMI|nr:protein decapping 5-like [Dorcoceras hygrometricum]